LGAMEENQILKKLEEIRKKDINKKISPEER
jgi:hypothetical protein